jgi:hypothetical protein
MLWRMSAEPHLDRIGIMLVRLDNLPQRHRSKTLHAAAPEVDFRTSVRCGGAKEFPVATIRAGAISRPTPAPPSHRRLAYRLRQLREFQDPDSGRAAPGLEIGLTLAETAETPAMGRPARYRDRIEGRAERSETHSDPIAVRKYSWGRHWETPAPRCVEI